MNRGSIFISTLDLDMPIELVRLQAGAIVVTAILRGPARVPAGRYEAALYGEDGLQVGVITLTLAEDVEIEPHQNVGATARLEISACTSMA